MSVLIGAKTLLLNRSIDKKEYKIFSIYRSPAANSVANFVKNLDSFIE